MRKKIICMVMPLLVLCMGVSVAQEMQITGTVVDQDNLPLPGVSVVITNTKTGTQTDFDGNYSITASVGQTIRYSYVGQTTVTRRVESSSTINVQMVEDAEALDEVVVVAFGTSTKEAFTGSATVVGADDLALRTVTSPIAAIEGKATGVQFISSSGQPGSTPNLVIRGVGTLNGGTTDPLYIVDGVQFEGAITSLNQNDIESLTILKDAASTSLYGSRAANGVVIIKTKSGKKNTATRVNFSTLYGVVTKGVPEYNAVNPGQYYELMWEAYKNTLSGADPAAEASASIYNRLGYNPFNVPNDQIVGVDGKLNPNAEVIYDGLDWYDALERVGSRINHSLDVSSGGENSSFYFSTSYLNEKGYVIKSDFDRLTTRMSADFTPTKWLSLGGNINLSLTTTNGVTSRDNSIANPFGFAKNMGSIYPVYLVDLNGNIVLDDDGNQRYDYGEGYSQFNIQSRPSNPGRHAIAEALFNSNVRKTNNIGLRYFAEISILDGLKARLDYGQDYNDYINKVYENNIVGDGAPAGRYRETRFRRKTENFTQLLTYNKSFNDKHNLDITLGHESFNRHYSEAFGFKNTQTAEGIYEFDNFSVATEISGYSSDRRIEGFFGRANYNYDSKYYISGSVRRDGSSVFSRDSRWGTFYSVGGSWRIDQEDFIKNTSWIDRLKLRASYGEVGNDNLDDFYISQARTTLYSNAGAPAIYFSDLGNESLQWETSVSWDVALEFRLFNNFLDGSVEYYKKNSTDLLYNLPIPTSEGLNEAPFNIADMYNSGVEMSLTGHLVNKTNFNWDLTLQASTLKNEITSIPDPFINGSKRWAEGRSRYDYFIYDYAGVDPANGDALYNVYEENEVTGESEPVLNADGTQATTHEWDEAGRAYSGDSSLPDLVGSVSNTFNYKGIGLNFVMVYGIGGKILDFGYADMMHEGSYGESLHPDALRAWRVPGDITDVPRLENGENDQVVNSSTRFLTSADYFALRNVNLSYTFSNQLSDTIGVDNLRFFLSGENLYLSSKRRGLDPQYSLAGTPEGNDYNPARVVSFGINVSF